MVLRRTTYAITQRCTLKCKLCLAFAPYYKNPCDASVEEVERALKRYFELVDEVGIFSLAGGEPLMHKNLSQIFSLVLQYQTQIKDHIDIVTNGTLLFSPETLQILMSNPKIRVIISDYGKDLSRKVEDLKKQLEDAHVFYRIQNYAGDDNWLYNGWVDFRDHSIKHFNEEEIKAQAKSCIFRQGHYYVINEGELHPCSRQYWRMREGIMPKDKKYFVDLLANESVAEQRVKLERIENLEYLLSCSRCEGVRNNSKRYKPAEQL